MDGLALLVRKGLQVASGNILCKLNGRAGRRQEGAGLGGSASRDGFERLFAASG